MILHVALGTLGLTFISNKLSMHRILRDVYVCFHKQFSSIITACYLVMVGIDEFFVTFEEEVCYQLLSRLESLQSCTHLYLYALLLKLFHFNLLKFQFNLDEENENINLCSSVIKLLEFSVKCSVLLLTNLLHLRDTCCPL